MPDIEVKLTVDNTKLIKMSTRDAIITALEAVGLQAEGYAKRKCPVDTGLLRNSITHAVGGVPFSASYHASYGSARTKSGKRRSASAKNAGTVKIGRVSGTVGSADDMSAYIGTNVEYAAYVEYGTSKTKAQPFIAPAVENHSKEYMAIIRAQLLKEVFK